MVVKWIRSILSASRQLVGKDHLGNSYFETLKGSGKVQRSFESSLKHEQYASGVLPHEWEAWLRGKRTEPPSTHEIEKNSQYLSQVQGRAAKRTAEDDKRQAEAFAEGLIQRESSSQPKTVSKKTTTTSTSQPGTDTKYQPDTWKPGN